MNNYTGNATKKMGYTIYVANWIDWYSTKQGVFGCSVTKNDDDSLFYKDYSFCKVLESASIAEMRALIKALNHIPSGEAVLLKTSQPSIVSGINYGLAFWIKQNWKTKDGNEVKYQSEWIQIQNLIKDRKIHALHTLDDDINILSNACKQYFNFISFNENEKKLPISLPLNDEELSFR